MCYFWWWWSWIFWGWWPGRLVLWGWFIFCCLLGVFWSLLKRTSYYCLGFYWCPVVVGLGGIGNLCVFIERFWILFGIFFGRVEGCVFGRGGGVGWLRIFWLFRSFEWIGRVFIIVIGFIKRKGLGWRYLDQFIIFKVNIIIIILRALCGWCLGICLFSFLISFLGVRL